MPDKTRAADSRKTVYLDAGNVGKMSSGIGQIALNLARQLAAREDDALRYALVVGSPDWVDYARAHGVDFPIIVQPANKYLPYGRCPPALREALGPDALWHALYPESTHLRHFRQRGPIVTIYDAYGHWQWDALDATPEQTGWPWDSRHSRLRHREKKRSPRRWVGHRMAALAAQCADTLVYASAASRAQFEAEHVVGPQVRSVVTHQAAVLPDAAPSRPAWLPERPFLLAVSHFQRNKNLHWLPACLAHLPDDWILVLAGHNRNRYGAEVSARLERHPARERVLLPGVVSEGEKTWLMAHCLALLMPSLIEGFGLPALESMLSGRPAVVTAIPVLREMCAEHAFYIHNYADPKHIAEVAQHAVRAHAEKPQLAAAAKTHAQQFTYQRVAQASRALYLERLARDAGSASG